jgi:outer membrane protein assembly factor BamD
MTSHPLHPFRETVSRVSSRCSRDGSGGRVWPSFSKQAIVSFVVFLVSATILSCAGTLDVKPTSAEDQFERGKRRYEARRYLDSIDEFKLLLAQYPGSKYVEPATFYLGKCHYETKEFPLADVELARIVRDFPRGDYAEESTFLLAMCAFKQKRSPHYDQSQTRKAAQLFSTYLANFPQGTFLTEAEEKLRECRALLAEKLYHTGELYIKLSYFQAARLSFQQVLDSYGESKWADWALLGIGKTYEKEKAWDKALETYESVVERDGDREALGVARQRLEMVRERAGA